MILPLLLLLTTQVVCDPDMPTHCAAPAIAGEPAELDGTILSPDLAIHLGQQVEGAEARLQAELDRKDKLHQIDLTLARAEAKADLHAATASTAAQKRQTEYWEARTKIVEQKLSEGPPWYETHTFGIVIGVGVTVLIVGIIGAEMQLISNL